MDKTVDPEVVGLLLSGIVVMLLLALALVAFFLIYQKKLIGQQLALQTIQSAYQKELLVAAIAVEEQERKRIGNDLHDEIGSSLSAAKVLMEQVGTANSSSEKEQEIAGLVKRLLSDSVQDIRRISQNLHPAVLARFGLAKALQNLGGMYAEAFAEGLAVQVELAQPLPAMQELALYRIVQELVTNVLKHAQATRVEVQLVQQPHAVVLTVTDNGRGFDPAQAQLSPTAGLGLKSLAARVSLLDATLKLDSGPDHGTIARVEVPL